jgi:hypothetical protein
MTFSFHSSSRLFLYAILLSAFAMTDEVSSATPPVIAQPPSPFNLIFPIDRTFTQGNEPRLFDWEDSIDPDGGTVTYDFYVNGNLIEANITTSHYYYAGINGISARLPIQYSWQVVARDNRHTTSSNEGVFYTKPPGLGDPPGSYISRIIQGIIYSDLSLARIASASIQSTTRSLYFQQSQPDGSFLGQIIFFYDFGVTPSPENEIFQLTVGAPGYITKTLQLQGGTETYITVDVPLSTDNDGDGIADSADSDDDNDGYSDEEELNAGSNLLDPNDIPRQSGWKVILPFLLNQ